MNWHIEVDCGLNNLEFVVVIEIIRLRYGIRIASQAVPSSLFDAFGGYEARLLDTASVRLVAVVRTLSRAQPHRFCSFEAHTERLVASQ